jgi:L-iditol 2-dehydrogenase
VQIWPSLPESTDPVAAVLEGHRRAGADVVITAASSAARNRDFACLLAAVASSLFGGLPKDHPTITVDSNLMHCRELTIVEVNGSGVPLTQQTGAPS